MAHVGGGLRLLPAGPQASIRIGAAPGVREATAVPDATREDGGDLPRDRVEVSDAARRMAARASGATDGADASSSGVRARPANTTAAAGTSSVLTDAQQRELFDLQAADRSVRAHEAAHMAAGGSLAGGATYTTKTGPDGKEYAVAGEVPIELSSVGTPEERMARARQVRASALAPADPSPQDLRVAAEASSMELAAMLDASSQARTEVKAGAKATGPQTSSTAAVKSADAAKANDAAATAKAAGETRAANRSRRADANLPVDTTPGLETAEEKAVRLAKEAALREPGDEVAIATLAVGRRSNEHSSGDSCAACIGAVRTWSRAAASPA